MARTGEGKWVLTVIFGTSAGLTVESAFCDTGYGVEALRWSTVEALRR